MDYISNDGLSRKQIRQIATWVKKVLGIETIMFPVLHALEILVSEYDDVLYYSVDCDSEFEYGVQAYLQPEDDEYSKWCIHIRESVYIKATQNSGDCLGFICHEMCHFILIYIYGVKPNSRFSVALYESAPAYKSIEWQAKALCGELMIPYEMCKNMTFQEIKQATNSSNQQIEYFLTNVVKKEDKKEKQQAATCCVRTIL